MANVRIGGADDLINTLSKLNNKLEAFRRVTADTEILKRDNENTLKNWQKVVLPEIVGTRGQNIGYPFRRKRGGFPPAKYRKFDVPFGWVAGVWSGVTYYALMQGKSAAYVSKKGNSYVRSLTREITADKIVYGFSAQYNSKDVTKYINFSIGVTDEWLRQRADARAELYQREVQKILGER